MIWHGRCDCGKEIDVDYNSLVYTSMKSCDGQKKEKNWRRSQYAGYDRKAFWTSYGDREDKG